MLAVQQKVIVPKNCGKKYRTTPYAKVKDATGREWPKALPIEVVVNVRKTYPNDPCPCGKTKKGEFGGDVRVKFKNCCRSFL